MKHFDVAVIGGGIVGCASAYYLSKAGASVVIIDQGQLNRGASGRNAGSLHFQLEHRFLREEKGHWDALEKLLPLNGLAVELWENIEAELDCDLEVKLNGGLMVAETEDQLALLKRKNDLEKKCGIGTEILSGDETRTLCPILSKRIIAASYYAKEGHCNPRLATTAFAKAAGLNGAHVQTESEVVALQRKNDCWDIDTKAGNKAPNPEYQTIKASKILNAANAEANTIAAMANYPLQMFNHYLTINVTEKLNFRIPYMLQHVGRKLSLKQVKDGSLIIGGGWPAKFYGKKSSGDSNMAAVVDVDSVIGNMKTSSIVIPDIEQVHLLRSWAGTTSDTSDRLPLLGKFETIPDFYIATGGNGVTYGLSYAKLISEKIITGISSLSIDAFSPDRFHSSRSN